MDNFFLLIGALSLRGLKENRKCILRFDDNFVYAILGDVNSLELGGVAGRFETPNP